MRFCKYCNEPLLDGQKAFCDIICRQMAYQTDANRRKKKKPDKFDGFIRAQKQAKKEGVRLSYGQYQANKYIENQKIKIGKE